MSVSQKVPVYPASQEQVKVLSPSVQVPCEEQSWAAHSFTVVVDVVAVVAVVVVVVVAVRVVVVVVAVTVTVVAVRVVVVIVVVVIVMVVAVRVVVVVASIARYARVKAWPHQSPVEYMDLLLLQQPPLKQHSASKHPQTERETR
jgi:hypothetical protein